MGTFKSVNSLGVHPAQAGLGVNPSVIIASAPISTSPSAVITSISSTTITGSVAAASTGNITLISSAVTGIYVYAYTISGPTAASSAGATVPLCSGSTALPVWNPVLVATSTILGGIDSQVVTPPAYLFRTADGSPLIYAKGGSSVSGQLTSFSFAFWRQ